ncbi:MAG: hypothetical protein WCG34_04445, partial [Leptolinea sp.]
DGAGGFAHGQKRIPSAGLYPPLEKYIQCTRPSAPTYQPTFPQLLLSEVIYHSIEQAVIV